MPPDFNEEKKLWKKGYKRVACIDEVGRGALCGPVVAVAVFMNSNLKLKIQKLKIKDSKKLTPKKREEFYKVLTKHPAINWGFGRVSEKIIDKINILEATKLAMEKAVRRLEKKIQKDRINIFSHGRERRCYSKAMVDFLILDGKLKLNLPIPQKSIVKADEKVFSCAAASIIAKVTRDRLMEKYAKKFPAYGFERHKGYGTDQHRKALKKHGHCKIHRKSFRPIKTCKLK